MKKAFLSILILLVAGLQTAQAQKMIVRMAGNQITEFDISQLEDVTFVEAEPIDDDTHGTTNGHAWVDLGLPSGTLWATCNIGANRPEAYGNYYAWGETKPKDKYLWETYKYSGANDESHMPHNVTKYYYWYEQGSNGNVIVHYDKSELEASDDAATANWGSEWQMPSSVQFDELIDNNYTTTEWLKVGGINVKKIISKINGNYIYLPAAGRNDGLDEETPSLVGSFGYYWSRTLGFNTTGSSGTLKLNFNSDVIGNGSDYDRYAGLSIRPVRVKKQEETHEWVNLGLPSGTLWATCNVGANSPEEYGDFFAWGEIEPKSDYSWNTYSCCKGSQETITKYCTNSSEGYNGFTDGLAELLPEDDAATANWGRNWQMPSLEQLQELMNSNNTTTVQIQQNRINGIKITSKSNGKWIFLPAADLWSGTYHSNDNKYGTYWTRSLSVEHSRCSDVLFFGGTEQQLEINYLNRNFGVTVRPVRKK